MPPTMTQFFARRNRRSMKRKNNMSKKITTGYSELQILFNELGIRFTDSGDAADNLGKGVELSVIEQGDSIAATFHFTIDLAGNETYDYTE